MKRILRIPAIAGALVAAVVLAGFEPTSHSAAQAGPGGFLDGGYYTGYGPGYSRYGYSPYGYGISPGYVYPSYGGTSLFPNQRYGGYDQNYIGSPYFGHAYGPYGAYRPYGYGVYGPYGYKLHGY